jgi:hypothetical protein
MVARAGHMAAHAAQFANGYSVSHWRAAVLGAFPKHHVFALRASARCGDERGAAFGKSPGAVRSYGELFESREMEKMYLAIIDGAPAKNEWACRASIGEESCSPKRMKVDERRGKPAETHFKVLAVANGRALIEAQPVTGRTHQIRVHLAQSGNPVVGDVLYGKRRAEDSAPYPARTDYPLALRSILLAYRDPFTGRRVQIKAPVDEFLKTYNFSANETGFSEWMK